MSSTENKKVFARNLRRLLDERGMQDKDLIEITGASQTAVSDWLNAKKYPRIDKIEKLANFFGVKKSDLIEDRIAYAEYKEEIIDSLVSKYMLLSDSEKEKALDYLNYLVEQSKKNQRPSIYPKKVP